MSGFRSDFKAAQKAVLDNPVNFARSAATVFFVVGALFVLIG